MDDLVADVHYLEMRKVEFLDRFHCALQNRIACAPVGLRQLLPYLTQRAKDACTIESLPFAMFAIAHDLLHEKSTTRHTTTALKGWATNLTQP